ncbi:MAG TPA: hypothetical protein VLA89_14865, partial [Gemmatimonadales bacterium]|nr:hypothetical protein [Gemmatimonadales bacterium]
FALGSDTVAVLGSEDLYFDWFRSAAGVGHRRAFGASHVVAAIGRVRIVGGGTTVRTGGKKKR